MDRAIVSCPVNTGPWDPFPGCNGSPSQIAIRALKGRGMETSDRLGAFRLALILGLVAAIVAVIPGVGMIMWYVGVPVAALVVILAIVTMVRGRPMYGFILIFGALLIPVWCWFAPFLSSGKVAAWIAGVPDQPAAAPAAPAPKASAPKPDPGKSSPAEPATPRPRPPVEPVANPEPMFAMREWTSSDGRKMRAELSHVFRNDDGLFAGHFVREDGKSFDMPVGRLSPEDLAEVKKAMGPDGSSGE